MVQIYSALDILYLMSSGSGHTMIATNMLGAEIANVGAQITPSNVRIRRRSALTISQPTARMTHFPSRAYHARGWFVSVGVPSPTGRRLLAGVVS